MHNTVRINNASTEIHNPTVHSPNAIIRRYVEAELTDIQREIQWRKSIGLSEEEAAQDLFAKAVQYEERGEVVFSKGLYFLVCIKTILDEVSLTTIPGQFIWNFCAFYTLLTLLFFIGRQGNKLYFSTD